MKNIFKNVIALVILGIAIFVFRDSLQKSYFFLQDKYFPCTRVITYSIGTFDKGFRISEDDFLNYIKESEDIWETVVSKDLFRYEKEGGELKINLVYDNRQASTQKLKNINVSLKDKKSYYNNLKIQIDLLQREYQGKKLVYETKINTLKDSQGRYSRESVSEINALQSELNNYVRNINSKVEELNNYASSFNNQAKDYNNIGDSLGEEFEEGLYHSDKNGKYIDIYQFENKEKLTRVLLHEMGHAFNLEHLDDKNAIMYRLNNSTSLIPTDADIEALRSYCKLK